MKTGLALAAEGRSSRGITLALLLLPIALSASLEACAARSLTYADLLSQLIDLDRLTRLQQGVTAGQFSSWHRGERERWGTNGDAGHYLRVEENGEAVMLDVDGPGCIYRIWSANPQGKIRLYLDGAAEPSYEWEFNSLFTGEQPPFIKPLVYKRGDLRSASDCYLPIPFARHLKIAADRAHGQYYIFDYLRFPDDWEVPSFRPPLTAEEQRALEAAAAAWADPGHDPKPRLPGQTTEARSLTVAPGETVVLADLPGPAMIRALRATVSCDERYFWRKLLLRGTWDDAAWPQILAPLGPFFGFDWQAAEYASLIAGCQEGRCYFYYPMPFRRSGRLELVSHLHRPAEVTFEVEWAPCDDLPEDTAYFFARWRREPKSTTFDYPFLETAGRGHLVGVTLQVDHPVPGWWGEGDEKVWVDGDDFPKWIGTGSEDYFGDAWGIRYLTEPSFGCSHSEGPRTCPYRWHFMDYIPFEQRLRMTIENYPPYEEDYSSVAYWYQAELTPPFERLQGATYIGGREPGQAPTALPYNPALFGDVTPDDVRTFGLDIAYAQEAEQLLADAVASGKARLLHDALLPEQFNMEVAVDFGSVQAGQSLGRFTLTAPESIAYFPRLFSSARDDAAEMTIEVGGETLEVVGRPPEKSLELAGIYLEEGEHTANLFATTAGRAIIDCLQLQPAQRADGAIEAEDQVVVSVTPGAEQPQPGLPMRGASAGRILEWHARGPHQGMLVRLDAERGRPYVLGVRPMLGPAGAIIQGFAAGEAIGPQFDLYAPEKRPADSILPLGPLPQDAREVEIRVVGRNPAATAYYAGLDYFRFEPLIISPDSAEGVWAYVLATRGCQYRIQNLGAQWLAGHHLWVQPSRKEAYVEIALQIPGDGNYEIVVRYTTSWDYALVQASLDGEKLGEATDCYTPQVLLADPITLGTVHLTPGRHLLRFQAVDKNPASRGYLMGLDYITVREPG